METTNFKYYFQGEVSDVSICLIHLMKALRSLDASGTKHNATASRLRRMEYL